MRTYPELKKMIIGKLFKKKRKKKFTNSFLQIINKLNIHKKNNI